jgi:hypothetical protein
MAVLTFTYLIPISAWADVVALYGSFTEIETYPQVDTTIAAEGAIPLPPLFQSEEDYL